MPLVAGQILQSRYRIIRPLGQGGMGAVYLAGDTHLAGRHYAVKENVPDPTATPQVLAQLHAQFRTEAQTLAHLDHPNLPKVYDFFTDGGNDYIVMEYVDGDNLADVLQQHLQRHGAPLPEKPVLIWIEQVLDALEYLHSQRPYSVIHRDIKPANIILTPQGKVKLVDFGLVKLLDPNQPGTVTVMRGMGTPEYTPLEQYAGAGHTDARSDIYALGATLYHLLTGQPPPDAHQRFADPSKLALPRQLNPALAAGTEAVILRAVEIRPDQRFQTAKEMRQTLAGARLPQSARAAAAPTVRAPRLGRGGRSWQPWAGGAAAGLLVLFFLAFRPGGILIPAPPTPAPTAAFTRTVTSLPRPEPTKVPALGIGSTMISAKDGMTLVYVPAGEFLMGSADNDSDAVRNEKPQHKVYLDAFWIDRTEVTNTQYRQCVIAGACQPPSENKSYTRASYHGSTEFDSYPVIYVDWNAASKYCVWADRRLPSEAEWEKAARGPDGRRYPWSDAAPDAQRANFYPNKGDTTAVGSYPTGASPYGAWDLAGNVWEWVGDWYNATYYGSGPVQNPKGPDSGQARVLRGGSWFVLQGYVRAAVRNGYAPGLVINYVGFRCARS